MLVKDVIAARGSSELWTIDEDQTLHDMALILRDRDVGALIVVGDDGLMAGVASERDLVRALADRPGEAHKISVGEVMTRSVVTCRPEDEMIDTLAVMTTHRIRHIPVVRDGRPETMISIREFDLACRELQELASTDALTNLTNRREFMAVLENEIKRHRRFRSCMSIAMLDIDHFKAVNDTFGHDAGDDVLRALSALLRQSLRAYDIVGRLGGEEFAVIFPNTDYLDGVSICERLIRDIREMEVKTAAGPVRVTASFGMTSTYGVSADGREYLRRADGLLYQAKAAGRDRLIAQIIESDVESTAPKIDRYAI